MSIKNVAYKLRYLFVIISLIMVFMLTSCARENKWEYDIEGVREISSSFSIAENGFFYRYYNEDIDDFLTYWYDFESEQSIIYCSKPGCSHNVRDCFALNSSGTIKFLYEGDLYYTVMEDRTDEKDYTLLMKSDPGGRNAKKVTEIEGKDWRNRSVFLGENKLYLIGEIVGYEYDDINNLYQRNGSDKAILYEINLDNGSVNEILLGEGWDYYSYVLDYHDGYLIVNSDWSEIEYDLDSFIQDKTGDKNMNYGKLVEQKDSSYEDEIMKEFVKLQSQGLRRGLFRINFTDGECKEFDLPEPLLVHNGLYYYNKLIDGEVYELNAFNMETGEEEVVYDGLAYSVNIIGDKMFIQSATGFKEDNYGINHIVYDKQTCPEYCIDLKTDKMTEIWDKNKEDAYIKILAEYKDKYIIRYTLMSQLDRSKYGLISKEDYLNGKTEISFIN